ncbi:HAD-IB family phosphatase [Akkermansiaceae bacterium]|nr:HAD-IB family phosphatase [Akkermansiaceae bacterium]MDB4435863.1 HAD-IB family phosphatase [Akkermansiaceae bacterium]MDB4500912.1 HAD-IB family phosphatase [Akkermansiaceae bacterium]
MKKIIAFDCDSTLSAIEGVDELARLAGPEVFAQVKELTNQAMNGEIAIEEVFARRLDLIKPTRDQCAQIGVLYIKHIEPTAKETIDALKADGWECLIISGGFTPCIEALATELGIDRIEAVPLTFSENNDYSGFDRDYPTTRNGGKPDIITSIISKSSPDRIVMVGDGVSDLETQPTVNQFIAYAGYTPREKVTSQSQHTVYLLEEIRDILI